MFFAQFDLNSVWIALALGALLVAQSWLIRRRRAWPGAIVPAAYLGLLGFLLFTGRMTQVVDWLFAALGLLALLSWWAGARRQREEADADVTS